MKKFILSAFLILVGLAATTSAQFFKSETTRKASEKMLQGDRAGAIAILDKAIEKRKDLLEAYQMRANLRSTSGDFNGAIADYSAAIEINPNDAKMYEQRARLRTFKRDSVGALRDLDAAIANGLKTEKVFTERASAKLYTGDLDGAITDYQAAIAINPNNASAQHGLAFALERNGNADSAFALLKEFLDRYESERDAKLPQMKEGTATGANVLIKREGKEKDGSQVYLQGGQFTIRGNSPEEIEKQMANFEQLGNLALAYASLGRMYAKKNELDKALENYEKSLKINKDGSHVYKLRSEIHIKKGDLQGAIEDLTIVAKSPMGAPDRHADKGLLLILQGKDEEAEKEFAIHLQRFPEGKEALDRRIEEAKKLRSQPPQQ